MVPAFGALGGAFANFGGAQQQPFSYQLAQQGPPAPPKLLTKGSATVPGRDILHTDKWDDLAPATQERLLAIECVPTLRVVCLLAAPAFDASAPFAGSACTPTARRARR